MRFSFQSINTKIQLFNSQCMTLYGCCLWNIESLDLIKYKLNGKNDAEPYYSFQKELTITLFLD